MNTGKNIMRFCSALMAVIMVICIMPVSAMAAADETLTASLKEAQSYIDGITVNNTSNDPSTVVSTFKTHFTWDNEKRENSKSYLFDWSYYNGVVFEGIEYLYEVTGDEKYADYVIEYMSSLIKADGTWAYCSNNSSKQRAGYNSTHGADCYKTASLLLDAYEMTGDERYLTMAATLYADLDSAASKYSLKNAGNNYRHTWATDPTPDLWLDGLYMILPFRAEYAKYIGDTDELDLIVDRMQWVSDNMYNSSKGLFYHAADSASSNSGTYWLRSIGWYAAAIVDIMDSMDGDNLAAMQAQLVKLVDGMIACQNTSNGMWLNNMNASKSSTNPYETSGTALVCYAIMKAVNNGWLDESYAQYGILAFNGICSEKLSGSTLTDICFKGAPGSSNSTFYNNEGKGVGPFIMFYAEVLEYVNNDSCDHVYETVTVPATCTADGSVTTACALCGETTVEVIAATGHNYTAVVTEPTCTEGGLTTYTCTGCGDTYTADETAAAGHDFETVTVPATCTADGSVTTACAACGEKTVEVIAATGHNYMAAVTEPTCTEDGFTTYTCTACGDTYIADETAATGHNYSTVTVEPTCTEGGYTTYTCTYCGDGYVYDETAALGHDYETVVVEAACETDGYSVHTCAACGDSYTDGIVSAFGHSNTSVVTEASCETDGYTTHTCTVCGEVTVDSYVAAAGHAYETVTTPATCTETGSTEKTCANCGDTEVEIIAATGHNYTAACTAPTCTQAGITVYTCENCDDSYTAETAALGHDYKAEVTAPTCTEDGYTAFTCANCGDTYTADETAALGHSYVAITRKATCTDGGYTIHSCENCDDSYTDSYTEALGHNVDSVVTEATCENAGYTTHTCTNCGETTVDTYVDALGHDYTAVITEATCTTAGFTTYTCANCGDSYTADNTAAFGHSYTCTEDGDYLVYTCESCGDTYTEEVANKTYTRVTSISSGNEYVITFYSGRKYYALTHEDNKISAVQVTVSNGVITSEITDDMVWSYRNKKLSYEDDGKTYYLYASKSNSWWNWWGNSSYTLSLSTSNSSSISFSNSRLKVGSNYLRYSNGSVTLSSSSTTTYLFIEE
ncbi:MAG: glycoside hydrolase family 88 protein [Oscillospiraceae bacterium]|nr:glycoside hydrolase family 88 protein [Oscillospiraceae bacterium]